MSSPTTERIQESPDPSKLDPAVSAASMSPVNPRLINWSAFLFAILQSVCSAFIALNGVRLLIGVGAFAAASGALKLADRMHIAAIRIPLMLLALVGSVLNLVVLWQVWRLRRRPASSWRQSPVPKQKLASEWLQLILSVLTLLLLAAEFVAHRILFAGRSCFVFSISSFSRSCNLLLYPTGSSNVLSSAVKIRIFRVESSIAEQISQCSRCSSISLRSSASTVLSMYSEMCSHTCLQSSFIVLSRRTTCVPEPSFLGTVPVVFAASFARGAAVLSPRQD